MENLAFSSLLDLVVGGKIVLFKDHVGAWKAWHFWPEPSVVDGVSSMIPISLWQDDNPYLKISQICHYVIAKCWIIYPDWGMIIIPSLDIWPMRNSGWMTMNHHRPQALWDIETAKQPLKSIFRGRGMRLQDHHGMTWNQHRGPTWFWMLGTPIGSSCTIHVLFMYLQVNRCREHLPVPEMAMQSLAGHKDWVTSLDVDWEGRCWAADLPDLTGGSSNMAGKVYPIKGCFTLWWTNIAIENGHL